MPKFGDINELNFTTEQLNYFEAEMKKYKVPFLYKWVFGALYKAGAIFFPLMIVLISILGFTVDFDITKIIALSFIFGLGILVVISYLWNRIKTQIWCKRLGLSYYEWCTLVVAFQITYI